MRTELLHVLAGRGGVALSLRNTATAPDGRTLDEHLATVLTLRGGLICAVDSFLSDVAGTSAYLARRGGSAVGGQRA
ncbi:hypothetical protein [Streptomyces tropicalis]|uniref:Uncharacterized protein n=1 Tax=Streptomyces tropicalis TaxID=3034234 RepID=A0ABT6A9U7_9ACTN|nr:hypothetical protein [Streptomyces tropicalis]MDF3301425.1 hypothetical protein [Streptomyces tropicalis]